MPQTIRLHIALRLTAVVRRIGGQGMRFPFCDPKRIKARHGYRVLGLWSDGSIAR